MTEKVSDTHGVEIGNRQVFNDHGWREAAGAAIHPDEDLSSIEIQQIRAAISIEVGKKTSLDSKPFGVRAGDRHELALVPAKLAERRPKLDGARENAAPIRTAVTRQVGDAHAHVAEIDVSE